MAKTILNEISKEVYEANKLKGFDVRKENIGQTLCLIHSEISEALEAIRKNKKVSYCNLSDYIKNCLTHNSSEPFRQQFENNIKDTFEDEIADTFIRLFDLCGALDIDIDKHIELKRKFNSMREFKHGKKF